MLLQIQFICHNNASLCLPSFRLECIVNIHLLLPTCLPPTCLPMLLYASVYCRPVYRRQLADAQNRSTWEYKSSSYNFVFLYSGYQESLQEIGTEAPP